MFIVKYDIISVNPPSTTYPNQTRTTYAMALGKVYTFGPTFRAENSNTSRHLAEFWMIEPEMAFYDLDANMDLAEDCIQNVIQYVLTHCEEDLVFLEKRLLEEEKQNSR